MPTPIYGTNKPERKPRTSARRSVYTLATIVALIMCAALFVDGGKAARGVAKPKADHGDVHSAWAYMQLFAKKRLKSPKTADFPFGGSRHVTYLGNRRYRVASYVDSQNGFGATLRTNFSGVIKQIHGGWELESLVFDE